MYDWLENHTEINRSEVFRQAIKSIQSPLKNKVSSLMFLVTIMGIVFSIVLIGISLSTATLTFMSTELRAMIALLGGILAVATSITYYKEVKKIKLTNIKK